MNVDEEYKGCLRCGKEKDGHGKTYCPLWEEMEAIVGPSGEYGWVPKYVRKLFPRL